MDKGQKMLEMPMLEAGRQGKMEEDDLLWRPLKAAVKRRRQ